MAKAKGRLTKIEQQYIKDNCEHKSYVDIAEYLERDPNTIKNYIETKLNKDTSLTIGAAPVKQAKNDIVFKPFWPIIETQFTEPELKMFQYYWNNIQSQFDYDILPTEELQIIDLVKAEIMMERSLNEIKECKDALTRTKVELELIDDDSNDEEEKKKRVQDLEKQAFGYRTASATLKKEYGEMQKTKNSLFKDLKATRADRIKRIDSRKESFISWIEDLMENPVRRKELGLKMEKYRLATEEEYKRLSQNHKYENGQVDQPILNKDTVNDDNE